MPCGSSTPSARAALVRAAPFALFIAFIAVQPLLEGWLDSRWLVAARGLAVGALLLFFWKHYGELRITPAATASQWMASLLVGVVVFAAWISFDSGWAAFAGGGGFDPTRPDGALDPWLVALRLLGLVLVVPVMEELFWRSLLMRWIDQRDFLARAPAATSMTALLASSVLFALEHSQWFAGLLAGLAYGWLYRRTGNLRATIASHAVTNALLGAWILANHDWHYW